MKNAEIILQFLFADERVALSCTGSALLSNSARR